MSADPMAFDRRLAAWDAYLASPWGRIRYDVVSRVLDEELSDLGQPPLRVLDLGGGDGVDSMRLASIGHDVTIVDQSKGMLDRARAQAQTNGTLERLTLVQADLLEWRGVNSYDVVLCHFVLPYLNPADWATTWGLIRKALRAGGKASVICSNPVAEVLSAIHRDADPELALRRSRGERTRSVTFQHQLPQLRRLDAERDAACAGLEVTRRVGVRVAVDLLPEGPAKNDPGKYSAILQLELALAEEHPYLDLARAWQLLLR